MCLVQYNRPRSSGEPNSSTVVWQCSGVPDGASALLWCTRWVPRAGPAYLRPPLALHSIRRQTPQCTNAQIDKYFDRYYSNIKHKFKLSVLRELFTMKLLPGKRVRTGKITQTKLERLIYYNWWWWEAVAVVGERQLHKPFVGSGKPHRGGPWSLSLAEAFSHWQWWGGLWSRTMNICVVYSHLSFLIFSSRILSADQTDGESIKLSSLFTGLFEVCPFSHRGNPSPA